MLGLFNVNVGACVSIENFNFFNVQQKITIRYLCYGSDVFAKRLRYSVVCLYCLSAFWYMLLCWCRRFTWETALNRNLSNEYYFFEPIHAYLITYNYIFSVFDWSSIDGSPLALWLSVLFTRSVDDRVCIYNVVLKYNNRNVHVPSSTVRSGG